jgi:hypothetical protein
VLRDLRRAPSVIEPTLLATPDAADGLAAVKERHGLVVLSLPVLNDQRELLVVAVHRKANAAPARSAIAQEPGEGVLPLRPLFQDFIAEVEDIRFVAVLARSRAIQ